MSPTSLPRRFVTAAMGRSRTVLSLLLLLVIAGALARSGVGVEAEPDVTFPAVSVSVFLEGASPADTDRLLARPLYQHIAKVDGVTKVRTYAYLGRARVVAQYDADFDVDQAVYDLRNAVSDARPDLPEDIQEPSFGNSAIPTSRSSSCPFWA